VPAAVTADADVEYKDYRSYYKYMCLPMGYYNLNLYDSYGDGWDGGRITLTQMVNASAGCQLLSETMPTQTSSRAVGFTITVSDFQLKAAHRYMRATVYRLAAVLSSQPNSA
jgi:hypothetical protein